jgi:hypothetical protein
MLILLFTKHKKQYNANAIILNIACKEIRNAHVWHRMSTKKGTCEVQIKISRRQTKCCTNVGADACMGSTQTRIRTAYACRHKDDGLQTQWLHMGTISSAHCMHSIERLHASDACATFQLSLDTARDRAALVTAFVPKRQGTSHEIEQGLSGATWVP